MPRHTVKIAPPPSPAQKPMEGRYFKPRLESLCLEASRHCPSITQEALWREHAQFVTS